MPPLYAHAGLDSPPVFWAWFTSIAALTLEEKLTGQKQIKVLESQRNEKRRSLFEAQDKVDLQREALIATIEGKLVQNTTTTLLFTIRWKLN